MNLLGMFAKYWKPGAVKTRLAARIGAQPAADLHRAFVHSLAVRFKQHGDQRQICYAPASAAEAFRQTAGNAWDVAPQVAGDLGARMEAFFDLAFESGASRVVLIGSDSPSMPSGFIDQAFEQLRTHPVVIGPAEDGGYYLIGAAGETPPVFKGIAWSSGEVWKQTVAALRRAGIGYASLPMWYDVDEWPDLQRLASSMQTSSASPERIEPEPVEPELIEPELMEPALIEEVLRAVATGRRQGDAAG